MDFVKAIAVFFVSPFNLMVTLAIIGIACKKFDRPVAANRLWLCSILLFVVFTQRYTSDLLLYPLEHKNTLHTDNISKADYIFTPGCYYNTEGDVTEISRWQECSLQRLVQSSLLARQYNIPVIVTGGHFLADTEIAYASKAKQFLQSLGVPDSHIISIPEGQDTQTEILAIQPLISNKALLTVSSATHQTRLTMMISPLVQQQFFYPVDFHSSGDLMPYLTLPSLSALQSSRSALYEYVAILKAIILSSPGQSGA